MLSLPPCALAQLTSAIARVSESESSLVSSAMSVWIAAASET